ncbi:hypothetical protein Clacol_003376 [Clathrus columnatus]|uniref:SGNH hydrolase-type esterase domain-containing protein n=1 Tax=Clathrus columnatus TaxID=1419009 RepID=A0AAV5A7D2_9AGAM|nr:hypothetical protein Clacol_003376 [Clathrus columnatus]
MQSLSKVICASLDHKDIHYYGRWYLQNNLPTASWASATIRLAFSGRQLSLIPGPESFRVDSWNGGTKTVMVRSRLLDESSSSNPWSVRDVTDVEPGKCLVLFNSELCKKVEVEVVLVDWASRFQIESFVMEERDDIIPLHQKPHTRRLLFIGDSITSGFCNSGNDDSFSRGVMDAYPFACKRALDIKGIETSVDVLAFPGIRLVGEHDKKGAEAGMAVKLTHESAWMEENPWSFDEVVQGYGPTVTFIALGVNDDENDVPIDIFVKTYSSFLLELAWQYQNSLIHIIVLSPWSPSEPSSYEPALRQATLSLERSEIWPSAIHLHHVSTDRWYNVNETFDGLHPTVEGHEEIATKLVEWLQTTHILDFYSVTSEKN